jgi:Cu/Ag efflux protein CusF
MKKTILVVLSGIASAFAFSASAAEMSPTHGHGHGHAETRPETERHEGELVAGLIRRVDKSAGKITISHEALANLGMPPMTMSFRVKDASWLDRVKAGDRIRFAAESINGALTVVRLEIPL